MNFNLLLSISIVAILVGTSTAYAQVNSESPSNDIAFIETSPNVFEYKGNNYNLIEDYNIGTATWSSVRERVEDGTANGKKVFKDYILREDGDRIYYESMQSTIIYNKSECAYTVYPAGKISTSILPSVSWIARTAPSGTDDWTPLTSLNNQNCNVQVSSSPDKVTITSTKKLDGIAYKSEIIEVGETSDTSIFINGTTFDLITLGSFSSINNSTGQNVTGTIKGYTIFSEVPIQNGKLSSVHTLKLTDKLKETFTIHNNDIALNNNKFGATQTIHTGATLTINDTEYNIADSNGLLLDRTWIEENKAQIFEIANNLNYDFDVGFEKFWAIRILNENNQNKIALAYSNGNNITPVGGAMEIDPTLSNTNTDLDGYVGNTLSGTACNTTGHTLGLTGNSIELYLATSSNGECERGLVEWDISSIPSSSQITDVDFLMHKTLATNPRNCDVYGLATKPTTSTATQMWNQAGGTGSTTILTNDSFCTTTGTNYNLDLGANGDAYATAQLSSGWFGLGLKYTSELKGGSAVNFGIASEENTSANPAPVLSITYELPTPTPPTALTGNFSTLSWTAPSNIASVPVSDYIIQYSTNDSTWTTLDDGVSTNTSTDITGLINGQALYFHVLAVGNDGNSAYSTSFLISPTVPSAISDLSGTFVSPNANLDWSIPSSNGASITLYKIFRTLNAFAGLPLPDSSGTDAQLDFTNNELLLHADSLSSGISATGGTITYSGGYTIHTFTSSGTFTPSTSGNVEYLVIGAGGGGGGSEQGLSNVGTGAGGGAGGYRTASGFAVTAQDYTITVGTKGLGAIYLSNVDGTSGGLSTFSTITSSGGGRGGGYDYTTANGGSGGGAGGYFSGSAGTGTSGQGNDGGSGSSSASSYGSGGGGGSASVGSIGTSSAGGNGGTGTASSISGSSVTYSSGGGGGCNDGGTAGTGSNGGGNGSNSNTSASNASGYGNGGGGSGNSSGAGGGSGGDGSDGIVIIRYLTSTYTIPDSSINNITATATGTIVSGVIDNALSLSSRVSATGGTITTDGDYTIHTFTTSGTFTPSASGTVEYLVVAGGGSGGGYNGGAGGGGAGGYRTASGFAVTAQAYTITVGQGGTAGLTLEAMGVNGGDSIFSTITSTGGGGGADLNNGQGKSGNTGGSGGGASPSSQGGVDDIGGAGNTPSTSPSQGNNGGNGKYGYYFAGGGGGSSSVGGSGTTSVAGAGGTGTASSISGSSVTYAGGGGGSVNGGSGAGAGGSGIGGNGAHYGGATTATAGATNTGSGGGGGGAWTSNLPANGGSGIVIIKYLSPETVTISSSLLPNSNTSFSSGGWFDTTGISNLFSISNFALSKTSSDVVLTESIFSATGGTITYDNGYAIHTFTTTGQTFTPSASGNVEYLVVGGGGGGGGHPSGEQGGGGGGAGGYRTASGFPVTAQAYTITVGSGGIGGAGTYPAGGAVGGNSVFSTITSTGGGGAGGAHVAGSNGGSGGGGSSVGGGSGSGTSGQGNNGGNGSNDGAGGGGGAGAVGSNAVGNNGGAGGVGVASSITGSSVTRGGGGGGGSFLSGTAGAGGVGGGGGGGSLVGSAGTANTGGGGGGSSYNGNNVAGGSGGSGIVIIKYALSSTPSTIISLPIVLSDTFHQITLTRNVNNFILYVDNATPVTGTSSTSLGTTPTYTIYSKFDEFFINSDVLSSGAISDIYNRGAPLPQIATSSTDSYQDGTVVLGTTYYYKVKTTNAIGDSANSNTLTLIAIQAPDAPTSLTATFNPTTSPMSVDLSWTAPASNGGSAITDYIIQHSTDQNNWTTYSDGVSTDTTSNLTGFTNGITYYFRVSAVSSFGTSAVSNVPSVLFGAIPDAITDLSATGGNTQAVLSWTAPYNGGIAITDYVIQVSPDNSNWSTFTDGVSASTGGTVTGLTNGITYYFKVSAVNVVGTSAVSNIANALVATIPNIPTGLTATGGNTQAVLEWTAPVVNGGSAITDYIIQHSTDQTNWTTFNDGVSASTGGTVTGLTNGVTYYFKVKTVNAIGSSDYTSPVSTIVRTVPSTPTGLTVTPTSISQIDLSWVAPNNGGADITGYKIEFESPNGSGFSTLVSSNELLTYSHVSLTSATQYNYKVSAINIVGTGATTTPVSAYTIPNAPTGLTTTGVSISQIDLEWTAPSGTVTSYKIEQKISTGSWTVRVASTGNTNVSYSATELADGVNHTYRVSAINSGGTSSTSNESSAYTFSLSPSALVATPTSTTAVNLSWTAPISFVTGYKIEQKIGSGGWTVLTASTENTDTSYNDVSLTSGTQYTYRVSAVGTILTSPTSNESSTFTLNNAPTELTLNTVSQSQILLSWTAPSGTVTGYKIEEKIGSGSWATKVANTGTTSVSYSSTGLSGGTLYSYRVSAINLGGTSATSNEATKSTIANAPTSLTVSVVSNSQINLSWNAPAGSVTGYKIEEKIGTGSFTVKVANTGTTSTTASITDLTGGTLYTYRVYAINSGGTSVTSNEASGTTILDPPTSILLTTISQSQIDLSWTAPVGTVTGYKIEEKVGSGEWSTRVVNTGDSTVSYSATGLDSGVLHAYRLYSINSAGTSTVSEEQSTYTITSAPVLTLTTISSTRIDLAWTSPVGIVTGYKIEEKVGSGSWSIKVANTLSTVSSYSSTALTAGTQYTYRVSAISAVGTSITSNEPSAYTIASTPTLLSSTPMTNTRIDLYWSAPSGSVTGYKIEEKIGVGGWSVKVADTGNTNVSYSVTGLSGGTLYTHRISTINTGGTSSTSNESPMYTKPDSPTSVVLSTVSTTAINLSWTAPSGVVTGYKVERESPVGGGWSVLSANIGNVLVYSDSSLVIDTNYNYRISAINTGGTSTPSDESSTFTLINPPVTVTSTPSDATSVVISWTLPVSSSSTISGYKIEQSKNGGAWEVILADSGNTLREYTKTGLDSNNGYQYRISVKNQGGFSTASTSSSITYTYASPSTLSSSQTNRDVVLTWTAPTGTGAITGYKIESNIAGAGWNVLTTTNTQALTYATTTTFGAIEYNYRVSTINSAGISSTSNVILNTSPSSSPTDLILSQFSLTRVDLSWTAPLGVVNGYKIEKSINGETWTVLIANTGSSVSSYSDTAPTVNTNNHYRVYAINTVNGLGDVSISQYILVFTNPSGFNSLTSSIPATDIFKPHLVWSAPTSWGSGTPVSYKIFYKLSSDTTFIDSTITIAYVSGTRSYDYTIPTPTACASYDFRITATSSVGSTTSNTSSSATFCLPPPPTDLTLTPTVKSGNKKLTLQWTTPLNYDGVLLGYDVYRQINNGGFTLAKSIGTSNIVVDSGLSVGTKYDYKIFTRSNIGTSLISSETVTKTLFNTVFSFTVTDAGGNAIIISPRIDNVSTNPSATSITIVIYDKNPQTSVTADEITTAVYTMSLSDGNDYIFDDIEVYISGGGTWFGKITVMQEGLRYIIYSDGVEVTQADIFNGDLTVTESRTSTYEGSWLRVRSQPLDYNMLFKYEPIDSTLPTKFYSATSVLSRVDQTFAVSNATSYYVSGYKNPTAFDVETASNGTATLKCNAQTPIPCVIGTTLTSIPKGIISDFTVTSETNSTASGVRTLGLEGLGDLFGLPLVFMFIIGLGAVFTPRTAQMGVLFVAIGIGMLAYMGFLSFEFTDGAQQATWVIIIILVILGLFIGKRYD